MSPETSSTRVRNALNTLRKAAALILALGMGPVAWSLPTSTEPSLVDLSNAPSVYVQGSWAQHSTNAAAVGVTLPWNGWSRDWWGGEVRGHWDINATRLSFDGARNVDHTWMFGLKPTLRWRADHGQSPWFVEAGIGLSYMTDRYVTVHKEFSTRFNFASHVGVGYNFGEQRRHELQMRLEHVSNAGIKHPNPGENFAELRYAYHF